MNRWLGTPEDSSKQASERSQRAARRTIAALPSIASDSDEADFQDCDTSFQLPNVDGNDDLDNMDAAELARQRALPFAESDYANDPDFWKKELKMKFDKNDVKYWFNYTPNQDRNFRQHRSWVERNQACSMRDPQ